MTRSREMSYGEGRTRITLTSSYLGNDMLISIHNDNAHLGAVAVAEHDPDSGRTSTSLITRRGHKDDVIAQKVAYLVTKGTKRATCVIAGIHIDSITEAEINEIVANADHLSNELITEEKTDER